MVVQSSLVFSTCDLPRREQFDAWRSFMAPVVDMELLESPSAGFPAEQTVWNLGSLVLTRALLPGGQYRRRFRHLRKNPLDHWCLVLSDDRGRPGDAAWDGAGGSRQLGIRSLARPFEGEAADCYVLSLFIPRDLFGGAASALDAIQGEIGDVGARGILADYLLSLAGRMPQVGVDQVGQIAEATRALVAACLAPSTADMAVARPVISLTILDKARIAIQNNLQKPGFGPGQLCRTVSVSRSRLYRLFEPLGGVTHYIQRQRLLQAHGMLSDGNNTETINRIGERFGFLDASGFSRSFRKEFGYSPSDARTAALSGFPRSPSPPRSFRAPPPSASPLGDTLRALHA